MKRVFLLLAFGIGTVSAKPLVTDWHVNYDESKVKPYTLEDPLTFADGSKVGTVADWSRRRREIVDLFSREMYGQPPPAPEAVVTEVLEEGVTAGGFGTRRQVRMWFKADKSGPHLDWLIILPRHAKKPVPVIMALNYKGNHELVSDPQVIIHKDIWIWNDPAYGVTNHQGSVRQRGRLCHAGNGRDVPGPCTIFPVEMLLARGYAFMTACYQQVSPDPLYFEKDERYAQETFSYTGVFSLWPPRRAGRTDETTSLGAWAWAMSRGLEYLAQVPELDERRCVATGYSRLGKTALLAASRDERFAACVPVQCGAGGVQLLKRDFGESVYVITQAFTHWVCRAYDKYVGHEQEMPFDQHLLVASIAPRPFLCLGFNEPWYDTKGEYLSCKAASPVWALLVGSGLPSVSFPDSYDASCIGPYLGYARRTENHGYSAQDWTWMLDFVDRHLKSRR